MRVKHFDGPDNEHSRAESRAANEDPTPSLGELLALAKQISVVRSARSDFIDSVLLSEPGYDMLLAMFIAHTERRAVGPDDLALAAGVPSSTALRWMRTLEQIGLMIQITHLPNHHDHFVELRPEGLLQISRHLEHAWYASHT
jgi:hypothetical protein